MLWFDGILVSPRLVTLCHISCLLLQIKSVSIPLFQIFLVSNQTFWCQFFCCNRFFASIDNAKMCCQSKFNKSSPNDASQFECEYRMIYCIRSTVYLDRLPMYWMILCNHKISSIPALFRCSVRWKTQT